MSAAGADPEFVGGGGWRVREHEPIWGSGGVAPVESRGNAPGQGVIFTLEEEFEQ